MNHAGMIRRTGGASSSGKSSRAPPPPQQTVMVTINAPQPVAVAPVDGDDNTDDEGGADDDDFGISTYGKELELYDERKCVEKPPWYEGVMALVFVDNDYVNNHTLATLTKQRKEYTSIIRKLEATKRTLKKILYEAESRVQEDMAEIATLLTPHANEIVKSGANLDRLRMSPTALMKISDLKTSVISTHHKSFRIAARIAAMDRRISSFENVRAQFTANIDVIIDANYAEYLARTSKNLASTAFAMIVENAAEQKRQAVKNVQENVSNRPEPDVSDEVLADPRALDPENRMPESAAPNADSWFGEAIKAAMLQTLQQQQQQPSQSRGGGHHHDRSVAETETPGVVMVPSSSRRGTERTEKTKKEDEPSSRKERATRVAIET